VRLVRAGCAAVAVRFAGDDAQGRYHCRPVMPGQHPDGGEDGTRTAANWP